jgi:hypothetical protein
MARRGKMAVRTVSQTQQCFSNLIMHPSDLRGFKKNSGGRALVAHACNPSYSGGRDQEDNSLKPAQANSSMRPCLEKNPSQKRAGGVAQGVGPEFKPQYGEKKKKRTQSSLGS